ncbi:hypothetical protein ACV229_26390 [Burkholderia sp. MR1-5-21]
MNNSSLSLTSAAVRQDSSIWFSAYKFGWGCGAFALPSAVVCGQLGAVNTDARQLLLAFELGKQGILRAVTRHGPAIGGERVDLDSSYF